ncbi:MAG: ADP-ribosylglycohydrolase family protein [Oscillospiraceae bacterium]|nr:ADP-ribosylglycohydrolase family protein [Oscillospiraceae bacterium]
MDNRLSSFRGCLLGLAAGDAMGYTVSDQTMDEIRENYGPNGLLGYDLVNGYAYATSYTQLAAYACNGLLMGMTRGQMRGVMAPYVRYVSLAEQEWARFQSYRRDTGPKSCWISGEQSLRYRRCTDNLMLDTLSKGVTGTMEEPKNRFQTPGALTSAVPVGLFFQPDRLDRSEVVRLGAEVVALTHGSPAAFLSGAALAYIVSRVSWDGDRDLRRITKDTMAMLKTEYGNSYAKAVQELCAQLQKALELSVQILTPEPEALDQICCNAAPGILAGALYAAMLHPKSLDEALIAAVNHSGDSAAVGALTGALVGAMVGADQIPDFYLEGLEPAAVLETLATDMHQGCPMEKMSRFFDCEWEEKYIAPAD